MKIFILYMLVSITIHTHSNYHKENIAIRPFHLLLQQQTDSDLQDFQIMQEKYYLKRTPEENAETLFLVYMAADNNLHYFAWNNIKQMATIGSNKNIKIVIQLNEPGAHKKTQRYLIEKNKAILLNQDQVAAGKKFNTGDPQTLIDFCVHAINRFPAKQIILVLWDHGTGYLDPLKAKTSNIHELFELNPTDMMLELNRSHEFMERIDPQGDCRGICFDETYRSYLSNQKLDYALKTICKQINRKFDIIGTDACMMQMVEFGALLQPYTNLMVGSEEVELGAGWNYKHVLRPFEERSLSPRELAQHIVQCYQQTYARITHDYTFSAANLNMLQPLVDNINKVGTILIKCLKQQVNRSAEDTIAQCRSKQMCTCFDEPSYIDLGHFYQNLKEHLNQIKLKDETSLLNELSTEIDKGLQLINQIIFANVTGKNIKKALGLSIYLPEKRIHPSYLQTPFSQCNNWSKLVNEFIHRDVDLLA
ncbi:TPA: hypothetical protein DIC20_03595 [Candidatus Dependentiae bacterium]|nr:MAG: hypothetical protein US03_C0001G0106 [candidate division TM6 bacterium GW2011_GWF2_36_131]KKQ03758.1 MAG: hypothetical protein US13_C0001G0098 [candidate division TM6 bacterium GW2011_GWE2_36_25]KKQ19903.1 MAG: hypothetical protein US32_C0003G0020 [candidate division TM6 bacterium GW2011_GWA2_36_9]HBR70524.1 hypothetical protein [Candidatus Dependentiae bacterium]HCU00760.1 hypothetical protein [Candidatus Dependentiae bacterium]